MLIFLGSRLGLGTEKTISVDCFVVLEDEHYCMTYQSFLLVDFFEVSMISIAREQAINMFYCVEFNKLDVIRLSKIIGDLKDIEICYSEDPTEPMLISIISINANYVVVRNTRKHIY
ncbi:unnamed protein product [Cunninghamella blakesleeana]